MPGTPRGGRWNRQASKWTWRRRASGRCRPSPRSTPTSRRVYSKAELLAEVWGSSDAWQDPATVTEHIRRLRRKIEADPDRPRWLHTVRGAGYRFEPWTGRP